MFYKVFSKPYGMGEDLVANHVLQSLFKTLYDEVQFFKPYN